MNEDASYLRAVSLHLSRTLDEIGLNTKTVKRRRRTFLYMEHIISTAITIRGKTSSWYHFGSQTEGATTPGLNSDLDTLVLIPGFKVIQDMADWERGKLNLLILQDDTAPGYCRLQLLRPDIPKARQDVPSECYTYDSSGRVIMNNTWIHNRQVLGMRNVRNGPARSECKMPGLFDSDIVYALGCSAWPDQAKAFTRRQRRHGWPTERLVQQAVQQGVFLVPVGYKLSPTEHLEWRMSASLAERCIMFSLSIVHIKCYVVLKMLMKTFVEPHVEKCISSYHCKTAVLYCTENTEPGFWREDNLLQCVTQCLGQLLSWVAEEFCPQFIISEENLFAGKVTAKNKVALLSLLKSLFRSSDRKLLDIEIDDLGLKLQSRLKADPSTKAVLDSLDTMDLLGLFDYERQAIVDTFFKQILLHINKNENPSTVVCFVYQTIGMLKGRTIQSNKHELRAVKTYIKLLYRWLGSVLASISLSRKTRVPRLSIQLLHNGGGNSDVTTTLKLASVFYCNGEVRKAGEIINRLEHYYDRNEIQSVCGCYHQSRRLSLAFSRELFSLKGRRNRNARFVSCVRFSPQEMHCTPPSLRYELFRSVGDDMQHRHPIYDSWMDLVVVDCLPYLYFLQYMSYKQLGQRYLQTRARENLDRSVRADGKMCHLETSWNLLGQCMELEQQPDAAMACYRTSLDIRPRNNAANWHVAILCYKLIRK